MSFQQNQSQIQILLRKWGPAALLMALIFFFSALPSSSIPDFGKYQLSVTKGGHALGYLLLGRAFFWGIGTKKHAHWLAFGLCILYAISDEFHQSFVPGRSPSMYDVGIDTLGAFMGLVPVILGQKKFTK